MKTQIPHEFNELTVQDKDIFDQYFSKMNGNWASSVCFISMLAWRNSIPIYYRNIGDYLCCLAEDTTTDRFVWLPLIGYYEKKHMELCMVEIIRISQEMEIPIIFTDISEWMLPFYNSLEGIQFRVSYEESLSDYLYTMDDFWQGLNKQSNRYDYNYLIRKHNPKLVTVLSEDIEHCMKFVTELWCKNHNCDFCQYGCLLDSARNVITVLPDMDARGIGVYIDDWMVGYSIVSQEKDQLVFHFKKSDYKYRGLNDYLHRKCCELFAGSAKIVNYTEDMNLEGLRNYKRKLANYTLSHKYELNRIHNNEGEY